MNWLSILKSKVLYVLSGAVVIAAIARLFNAYIQKRAVKKSEKKAQKDLKEQREKINDVEAQWTDQGKITDEEKKRDI